MTGDDSRKVKNFLAVGNKEGAGFNDDGVVGITTTSN